MVPQLPLHLLLQPLLLQQVLKNHPSVEEDLSLKIEVHDQTIWKSTPEL